jgi:hypothetical protein
LKQKVAELEDQLRKNAERFTTDRFRLTKELSKAQKLYIKAERENI